MSNPYISNRKLKNEPLENKKSTTTPQNHNSPSDHASTPLHPIRQGAILPHEVLDEQHQNAAYPGSALQIRNGGFGSDACAHPTHPNQFYALTDRGPNSDFKGSLGEGKQFLVTGFTPKIGLFELQADGSIIKVKEIILKDRSGQPISGLPNPPEFGGTNEIAYDVTGAPILIDPNQAYHPTDNPVKTDINGLDPEGLVALNDGSFWVSDEYGPHLVHYDAEGVEIWRINPFEADERNTLIINGKPLRLPAELSKRRTNKGMESLTITPDQSTLVGIMESSMDNPDRSGRQSCLTRLITINLHTGDVGQYLYRLDASHHVNSAIAALSEHQFYVVEHDRKFPLQAADAVKRIYQIDISAATNINQHDQLLTTKAVAYDVHLGLLVNGLTLEQLLAESEDNWELLADLGIHPVTKTLAVDVLQAIDYPHDKLEGIWLRQDGSIGLVNDDDFGMNDSEAGIEQKYLDSAKRIEDMTRLYQVWPN
ncbi:esterase-like activity of phytase family protein [Psychrobacter sp. FDAARGOS_221]|uniref:esterase-like activity of phytase family protein n=1 Tax=Psychrobacter sp. FDAARGOS_221 TaxID=1975705 RepID=UPI000BB547AE|nr:esterase-like activity of phytase family protein [Psychrobacter sp. FDAARGOS_221]PNK60730.1 phytase esterase-like protein [Psychrobacter sp. FDAARGOS_221]